MASFCLGTENDHSANSEWAIITSDKERVKQIKTAAEKNGIYDKNRLITLQTSSTGNNKFAIPVSSITHHSFIYNADEHYNDRYNITAPAIFKDCQLTKNVTCNRNKLKHKTDKITEMQSIITELAMKKGFNEAEIKELIACIPALTWVQHGDMIILSKNTFDHFVWQRLILLYGQQLWISLAGILGCQRIILQEKISTDGYRTPVNDLVLGDNGWVIHTDNGVHYVFDTTRIMFSQGNITEKIRMANIDCKDETIVDLFAGIGYFTLPILVHSGAKLVYACEWNPAAIEGLRKGLIHNKVTDKCIVLEGDNNQVAPRGVADRIILGLIPSSEGSWETGCSCLKRNNGGWLHVHGNVTVAKYNSVEMKSKKQDGECNGVRTSQDCVNILDKASFEWGCYAKKKISNIFNRLYREEGSVPFCSHGNEPQWSVNVEHIEHVKSYAPHIYHVVIDIECRPQS